jgi:hypothetical protein
MDIFEAWTAVSPAALLARAFGCKVRRLSENERQCAMWTKTVTLMTGLWEKIKDHFEGLMSFALGE